MTWEIVSAYEGDALEAARQLFVEYAAWLGFSLDFQGFDDELAGLPGHYAPPGGRLYIAVEDRVAIGCAALRPLGEGEDGAGDACELKRLYVIPEVRGRGVARGLTQRLVDDAREMGYRRMLLDTLGTRMPEAIGLYESLGFRHTDAYRFNPLPDACFMELLLST
jgi:GNAT superfamily N-acetyltransferase